MKIPYGDQALFLKADVFAQNEGYKNIKLMEDLDLVSRLNKQGRLHIIRSTIYTSCRRWTKLGVFNTSFINNCIVLAYYLGVSPDTLAHWYYHTIPGLLAKK